MGKLRLVEPAFAPGSGSSVINLSIIFPFILKVKIHQAKFEDK
jgi:hypothetical protein